MIVNKTAELRFSMMLRATNILFMRMRVYLVGTVITRTGNYLYAKNLSAFCRFSYKSSIWKNAHARFANLLTKVSNYS